MANQSSSPPPGSPTNRPATGPLLNNTSPRILNQQDLSLAYPSLYGVPSYCSIFADPLDLEPGPGQYDTLTSIGPQQLSHCTTMPSVSINAKHASSWSKVYISKQHAVMARDTPGPGAYIPTLQKSESNVRFGTSVRKEPNWDTPSPGPVYDIRRSVSDSAFGKVKFGKDGRFSKDWNMEVTTGPGQYNFAASFDGTKGLAKSFAVGHRAYDKVRFPGSERFNLGRVSPGPGQFRNWQPGPKRTGFPRANRKPLHEGANNTIVGPGSYHIDSALRKTTFAFGKPSTRARFTWKQNTIQMNSWARLGMAVRQRSD